MLHPPKDVTPAELWRCLIGTPRPTWPIEIEGEPLLVRAVTRSDMLRARRAEAANPGASEIVTAHHLIANAVRDDVGVAVFSLADIGALGNEIVEQWRSIVWGALSICGPLYGRASLAAWNPVLDIGARADENMVSASLALSTLDSCWEIDNKRRKLRRIQRPDRFFGLPLSQLTDGQIMAFRAAMRVWDNR